MYYSETVPNGWRKVSKEEFEFAIAQENFTCGNRNNARTYNIVGPFQDRNGPMIAIETDGKYNGAGKDEYWLPALL